MIYFMLLSSTSSKAIFCSCTCSRSFLPAWLFFFRNITTASRRTADVFPVVASFPPKNNVCEHERQNDFPDVKPFVLMFTSQIKGHRMQREWLIATSPAGVSWILARFTKYDLEPEFHNYNEVSCDVECWLLCEATAS